MSSQHEQAVAKAQTNCRDKVISIGKTIFQWHGLEATPHIKNGDRAEVKLLHDNGKPVTFQFKEHTAESHPVNLPTMIPRASLQLWPELSRKVQQWESRGMVRHRQPRFCIDYAVWFDLPHYYLKHIAGIERNALAYLACMYGQVADAPCKCCQLLMQIKGQYISMADCVKIEGEMGGKCATCFANGHDCDAYIKLEFGDAGKIHAVDDNIYAIAGIPDVA